MRKTLTRSLHLCFLLLLALQASGQRYYKEVQPGRLNDQSQVRQLQLDVPALTQFRQRLLANPGLSAPITIPLGEGRELTFEISANNTLSNAAGLQFPGLATYTGHTRDHKATLRLTLSEMGMMGMVTLKDEPGIWYVHPLNNHRPDLLAVYHSKEINTASLPHCGLEEEAGLYPEGKTFKTTAASGDCVLRTYRFAVAATAEYTNWAGSKANAAALIANTVNNLNECYENDLTIHLSLVLDSANIYTDTATDPFTTVSFPSSTTLSQSNSTINTNTGSGNYDVGMTFGYGWSGGLAGLGVTCGSSKGRAASGLNSGFPAGSSGPIFDNLVAHELAHQFNATHTMAANNGGCSGNVTPASSWEPGGGSTIMAYAGTCAGNAYQNYPDYYFHGGTIAQVMNFVLTGAGGTCPVTTASGNNSPLVSVPASSYAIPHSTPFRLSAIATDTAADVLTYCWEQLDALGTSGTSSPPSATATTGPQFRSFPPTTAPDRYFPALNVLTGLSSGTYQVLPAVARAMRFKVSVRDNHPGAGCTAYDTVTVNTQSCGPFSITNLTTATSLTANGTNTVTLTWNTAISCVATSNIDVLFSTDGGRSFPYTVVAATANDGTETFIVPNLPTCNGRFMIRANGNIYFNINTGVVTITSACQANGVTISPDAPLQAQPGDAVLNLSQSPAYGTTISSPISGNISTADQPGNLSYYDEDISSCNGPSNANRYDTLAFYPATSGTYGFQFTAPSSSSLVAHIYAYNYEPGSVCTNFIASSARRPAGSGGLSLSTSVSAALCANTRYVLVIATFNNSVTLPAGYTMNTLLPPGGSIANGPVAASGLNYCYVVSDKSTDRIMRIGSTADLRDSTIFQRDHMYGVYGISGTYSCDTLAARFTDSSFSSLRSAALAQKSGLCAQLSANERLISIGGTSLELSLLDFKVMLQAGSQTLVSWRMARQNNIDRYIVQRSPDGRQFSDRAASDIAADGRDQYEWIDSPLPVTTPVLYYRLKMQLRDGTRSYGAVVPVRLQEQAFSMELYPNPVGTEQLQLIAQGLNAAAELTISDLLGRPMLRQQLNPATSGGPLAIETSGWPAGMYFARIVVGGQSQVRRFLKK